MTESYHPDVPRRIVLWGATGAGKSTYLSTLVFYHRQPAEERRLCVLPADAVTAEWIARRLEVPPGVTGWAQVHGRAALPWPERIELDVWYVDHASLALDARILWRTVVQLFRPAEVYRGEHGGWRPS